MRRYEAKQQYERERMPLFSALRRYLEVLGALLRREEENRRQNPLESFVNLLEPIIMIATLSFMFYFLGRRQVSPLGGPPLLFYSTGFFPLYFFIYISRRMRGAIDAPQRRFPIEQRLDHIIVHVIMRIIDYTVLGIILFGGIYLFFTDQAIPHNLTPIAWGCLAIIALGFGWGVLTLVLSRTARFWNVVFPAVNRALILFTGVIFLPDVLAPDVRYALSFNPLLHAVQLFRLGFYPQYPAIILDVQYLAYCAVFALFFGLVLERVTRRFEGR